MRDAVRLVGLEARTGIDPDADGGCFLPRSRLRGDSEAVRERGDSGSWEGKNGSEVQGRCRVWGGVAEEAWVRVIETLDLAVDGAGKMVVVHQCGALRW